MMKVDIAKVRRSAMVGTVYQVLVSVCGLTDTPERRDSFGRYWPDCKEYRFMGNLGFGGKVWMNDGRIYVTCYPEDATPERQATIAKANELLAQVPVS